MTPQVILLFIITVVTSLVSYLVLRGKKDSAGKVFSIFILCISLWSFGLALFSFFSNLYLIQIITRFYYVAAAGIAFFFFLFSLYFPVRKEKVKKFDFLITVVPYLLLIAFFIFDQKYLIEQVYFLSNGTKAVIINYYNYVAYSIFFILYVVAGYISLIRTYRRSNDIQVRVQIRFIIIGTLVPYLLAMFFNLLLPVINYQYVWIGPIFALAVVAVILYAIFKHRLFDVKVIATEVLVSVLWIFILTRTFISENIQDEITNLALLFLTIVVGIFLIRSVRKEVDSRERIQKLAVNLEAANAGQQQFIHYLNHESKGYLTEDNAVLAAVRDGDFGEAPAELQKMATTVLRKNRRAVDDIDEMILSADLGSGAVRYTMEPFDLAAETRAFVEEYQPDAEEKGQKLEFVTEPAGADFTIVGDKRRLMRHALKNYLKNAIVYTPAGGAIIVTLSRAGEGKDAKVTLGVRDSGVGITPEDKARLFTEGGKGLHSTDVNPNSTGRGLYIVKQIIEAHHGRVFADSAGAGKGSTFGFEVPVGR